MSLPLKDKKPTKAASDQLERIISKLEVWQARHGGDDHEGKAARAKSELLALLRQMEELRHDP